MSKTTKAEFLAAWKKCNDEDGERWLKAFAQEYSFSEGKRAAQEFVRVAERYAAALAEEDEGEKLNNEKQESHDTQTIR